MADLARIKRNVSKMVSMSAPESDIDEYIQSEGVTIDDVRNFKLTPAAPQAQQAEPVGTVSTILNTSPDQLNKQGKWVQGGLLKTADDVYREAISPIMSGGSTFAAGVPKMIAKAQGAGPSVFPEQTTLPGKLLRGASEIAGFTAGLPGRAAVKVAQFTGKAMPKVVPKLLTKMAQGAAAGGTGGALAGDTLKSRRNNAVGGSIMGAVLPAISPGAKWLFEKIAAPGRVLSGIEKEVFEEASKKGFRNVLQSKFYSKKLPAQIQERIAQNLDNMEIAAGDEFDRLAGPLKKAQFDMAKFRGEVIKIANRVKENPFDTDSSKLDKAILDGVINKAQANNLGEALDIRRNLDDIIYSNKGELKTSFGKQVRDLLNKELHKNKNLENVDKEWSSLMEVLKTSKKVLGDTGEKILDRFINLTDKQKQMLVNLEKKIGGLPFVEDLTNYGLAKEFITRKVTPTTSGVVRAMTKPMFRGYLRTGENITKKLKSIDDKTIGRLLNK